MFKNTYSNPASFKYIPLKTFVKVLKILIRKIISTKTKTSRYLFLAELGNYFAQYISKNKFFCNLCKLESPYLLHTYNNSRILYNSICSNCSSRKRHRGLYEFYKVFLEQLSSPKILHFAPEPVFYKLFQGYDYLTADLELTDVDLQLNIQNIEYESSSFGLILSNHVLEHVTNDRIALSELKRILVHKGYAILTVPGNWNRNVTIEFDEPDNNGHYREYGLEFIEILRKFFTKVEYYDLFRYNNNYNLPIGLTANHDLVFLCQK